MPRRRSIIGEAGRDRARIPLGVAPMAVTESQFPPTLRHARLEQRLTQGQLAARIGVAQSAISFWERGIEVPTVEHLILLALELPAILDGVAGRERELLQRVLRLERDLFAGRCACAGCTCAVRPAG